MPPFDGSCAKITHTVFDDEHAKIAQAFEAAPALHHNEALVNQALNLHFSPDINRATDYFGAQAKSDPKTFLEIHQGIEELITDATKANDKEFAASLYRDLAIMDQGFAKNALAGGDIGGATVVLGPVGDLADPYNAVNALKSIRDLDPNNKDLPQLQENQKQLYSKLEHS